MRVAINLATEPFRRERAMVVGSIAVGVLLLGTLGMLVLLSVSERGEKTATRDAVARAEQQLGAITRERSRLEAVLRKPENAEVLERSLFLNQLLHRKGISWTRMFDDLEDVMPHNVRLIEIRPEVTPQNGVLLNMTIGAQTPEPVIGMVKRLESSPLFSSPSVPSVIPPSQNEPLYRYRLSVSYVQKL